MWGPEETPHFQSVNITVSNESGSGNFCKQKKERKRSLFKEYEIISPTIQLPYQPLRRWAISTNTTILNRMPSLTSTSTLSIVNPILFPDILLLHPNTNSYQALTVSKCMDAATVSPLRQILLLLKVEPRPLPYQASALTTMSP